MVPTYYPSKTRPVFFTLSLFITCCLSTESKAFYWTWDDYNEKEQRHSTSIVDHQEEYNLVKYIDDLLSEHNPEDPLDTQVRRKEAIAYLLATGGPNGFSQKPATKEEREILLKGCSLAAILHERLDCSGDLNLLSIRQGDFSHRKMSPLDQEHLVIAQQAITATRVLIKSAQNIPLKDFVTSVRELYKTEFRPVIQLKTSDREQQLKSFIQTFTRKLAERTKVVFEGFLGPISAAYANTIPLVCYTEVVFQSYLEQICRDESRFPDVQCRAHETTMKNGLIVTRKSNGSMIFTSKRSLSLGRVSFSPSSAYRSPIIFHSGPVIVSKYQSDFDFWTFLEETLGGIASGDIRSKIAALISTSTRVGIHDEF